MMNLMSLICQHHLSISQKFVIIVVMKCGSTRTTTANRKVGLNSTTEELLLAIEYKEAFQLTFSLAWLNIPHNTAMCLTSNFGSPSHDHNFFIILDDTRFNKNIVHKLGISLCIWANILIFFFLCDHGF